MDLVMLLLYFAPAAVAVARGHQSWGGIAALNLLLGWTLLGWVLALVWSLSAVPARTVERSDPRPQRT